MANTTNPEKVTVKGEDLTSKINTLHLKFTQATTQKSDKTLIVGTITAADTGEILSGAGIMVYQIDKSTTPATETYLGMTFTDANGKYVIPVQVNDNYEYSITAYSPLIKE
jgi:hypothetical protein